MHPVKAAWRKVNEVLDRKVSVKQTLPPYLLIGLLWWISTEADANARESIERQNDIAVAQAQYSNNLDVANLQQQQRAACIGRVESRANNIGNWHTLYDYLRVDLGAVEEADELQAEFDAKPENQPLSIEKDCAEFPMPAEVEIPQILIDEGIVIP